MPFAIIGLLLAIWGVAVGPSALTLYGMLTLCTAGIVLAIGFLAVATRSRPVDVSRTLLPPGEPKGAADVRS